MAAQPRAERALPNQQLAQRDTALQRRRGEPRHREKADERARAAARQSSRRLGLEPLQPVAQIGSARPQRAQLDRVDAAVAVVRLRVDVEEERVARRRGGGGGGGGAFAASRCSAWYFSHAQSASACAAHAACSRGRLTSRTLRERWQTSTVGRRPPRRSTSSASAAARPLVPVSRALVPDWRTDNCGGRSVPSCGAQITSGLSASPSKSSSQQR